jgi:hypothetical protein
VQIHNKLTDVNIGCEDTPICNCAKNEKYTYSETSEAIRNRLHVIPWWKLVWLTLAILCHSFILWLVARDALSIYW